MILVLFVERFVLRKIPALGVWLGIRILSEER